MRVFVKWTILGSMLLASSAGLGLCQSSAENLKQKIDAVIADAYKSASAQFPCKLKAEGKPKMLRWQVVDKCLNDAYQRVDWESISKKLQEMRKESKYQAVDFLSLVEDSLTSQAMVYDKAFLVRNDDVLLPLSNSVLKFLPPDSLVDLPVYAKSGERVGKFSGIYTFEKMGEISGARQYHTLFQYTDMTGNMQTSPGRLLLNSYGVPWKNAASQRGFRLPADKLNF